MRRVFIAALAALLLFSSVAVTPGPAGIVHSQSAWEKDNLDLLARVVNAEAGGEPYEGQVAVAAVIINRTYAKGFPSTIAGVVYMPGAFESVQIGSIWWLPMADTVRQAAIDALNGWDPTGGALYFFEPSKVTNPWLWGLPEAITIGHHRFAYGPNQWQ
ncbi:MAG: cell wall hydrolase [Symbiobacteriia bacterium]